MKWPNAGIHGRARAAAAVLVALAAPGLVVCRAGAAEPGAAVLYKRDLRLYTVYAWERWGNFINAQPGDGKEIPYDAAKVQVRIYTFASGELRDLDFERGTRTHSHVNQTDTIQYNWTGRRIQFSQDQAEQTRPGDAAFHPKGVFHHGEALETGKTIEFAYTVAQQQPNPESRWLSTASTPMQAAAAWPGQGAARFASGDALAGAPKGSARFAMRSYDFGPYVTRELHVDKGTVLPLGDGHDHLAIVIAGRFSLALEGKHYDLGVEDAFHLGPGQSGSLQASEDGALVETLSMPAAPR